MTPEELCDIVEQYADLVQVQWNEDSCGLSEDMTYVTLFNKGAPGRNIALNGLFAFATESAAKQFCRDRNENLDYLIGQLEGLWGIRGKLATNFSGSQHSNFVDEEYYHKDQDIDAFDLWPRVQRRCAALGVPAPSRRDEPQVSGSASERATEEKPATRKWWQFWN